MCSRTERPLTWPRRSSADVGGRAEGCFAACHPGQREPIRTSLIATEKPILVRVFIQNTRFWLPFSAFLFSRTLVSYLFAAGHRSTCPNFWGGVSLFPAWAGFETQLEKFSCLKCEAARVNSAHKDNGNSNRRSFVPLPRSGSSRMAVQWSTRSPRQEWFRAFPVIDQKTLDA